MTQHAGSLRETEAAAREVLGLPMYPELTDDQVDFVVEAVHSNY
jgi:dTDP-4-amino-4,6-dideoxygalactose transaminase